FTRLNIGKAFLFIKSHGIKAFLKKATSKLDAIRTGILDEGQITPQTPNENDPSSESIWDRSSEQYKRGNFKVYWELLPEVAKYQYKCMTGREDMDYLTYTIDFIKENIGSKNLRALSIGCSEGNPGPEMSFFRTGLFRKIEVMDIAEGLLKKQRKIAADFELNGIEYIWRDLNSVVLEKNAYDVIWAIGTVHHISELEYLFEQINYALKDHGIFDSVR
ncbi:MAG: class I SAM-dependent methyltransferase, partial [Syntrophales bacterium]